MKISVFGLGFVGTVTAACLADAGHELVCVDIDLGKVSKLNDGCASFDEPGINSLLRCNRSAGRLEAVLDANEAVLKSDISMVCVDVGNGVGGAQDTERLRNVIRSIGAAVVRKRKFHRVVIRSTVLPDTMRSIVLPILEKEIGEPVGVGFGLAYNPEFMREGSGITDFRMATRVVVGVFDQGTFDALDAIYRDFCSAIFETTPEIAETTKYVDNVWHALKISFANEIATVCQAQRIDSHAVMTIFRADRQLNISDAYLRPGFGFGGSCLSKDLTAIVGWSEQAGIELPLLGNVGRSNQLHIQRNVDWLLDRGQLRYAMIGLAYKSGIDDLRGSPFVQIALGLLSEGKQVRAFDRHVAGKNSGEGRPVAYLSNNNSMQMELVDDLPELIAWCDTVVLCTTLPDMENLWELLPPDKIVLDFSGMSGRQDRRLQRFV